MLARRLFPAPPVLLVLFACVFGPLAARADGGATINEEAKAYFRNGVELISDPKNPNYQDAYYQFKLAYEKSGRSWKVLGNLALCALKLERDEEAIEYYSRYLQQGATDVAADERKTIERDLLFLRGNMVTVVLTSDVAELQVVDARTGTTAPPQTYTLSAGQRTLGLRAGAHTFVARSGAKEQRWEVALTPGQRGEHSFRFGDGAPAPAPAASSAAPVVSASPTSPDPNPSGGVSLRKAGLVTAGIGGALVVGGVVTGLMSKSAKDGARDSCRGSVCPESSRGDFERAKSLAGITNILLIGGGLVAATGVTLYLAGAPKSSGASVGLSPAPLPGGGGLSAHGAFLLVSTLPGTFMLSRPRPHNPPRTRRLVAFGAIALALSSVRCTANYDDVEFVPDAQFQGASGATGTAGGAGQAGASGKAASGMGGASSGAGGSTTAGKAGASGAGAAGAAGGAAGQAGGAGKAGGNGGSAGAGQGGSTAGTAGAAGAGKGGTAGAGGAAGQAGKGGAAAGNGGASGAGTGGAGAGSGGGGASAGNGGTAGATAGGAGAAGANAGSGGAGAAGAAGAGGSPATEICDNGVDDDLDGKIDCADTQDCATSTCAPAVEPSWIGPLSLIDGDVDCGALQKVYHGFSDLTAAPAVCDACKCDPQQGATCTTGLHGVTGPDCEFDPCGPLSLNSSVSCASAAPLEAGCGVAAGALEYTGAKAQGGTCQPSPVNPPTVPPSTWGKEITACQAAQQGAGCVGGVCAVAPPPGAALCVAQAGDQTCPTGYGSKRLYFESLQDDRACSACSCGGAAGGTCAPNITIYTDASCTTQQIVFTTAYSCAVVPQVAGYFSARSYSYQPGVVTGATCPPSGGAPIGAATPVSPITFCCVP